MSWFSDRDEDECDVESPRSSGSATLELRRAEDSNHRLQRKLAQWMDVATQLFHYVEKSNGDAFTTEEPSPLDFLRDGKRRTARIEGRRLCQPPLFLSSSKENEERPWRHNIRPVCEDSMAEELQAKLEQLGLKSSKLSADLSFARQKEVSMKNALYEKNKQLEAMRLESRQLVEQLSEIEESFNKQIQDYEVSLRNKTIDCAKWEATSLELQKEQAAMKQKLDNNVHQCVQLEQKLKDLEEQKNEQHIQNTRQKRKIADMATQVDQLKKHAADVKAETDKVTSEMKTTADGKEKTIKELKSMVATMESRSVQHELHSQTVAEKLKQYEDLMELQKLRISEIEDAKCRDQKEMETLRDSLKKEKALVAEQETRAVSILDELQTTKLETERLTLVRDQFQRELLEKETCNLEHERSEKELSLKIGQLEKDLDRARIRNDDLSKMKNREKSLESEIELGLEESAALKAETASLKLELKEHKSQIEELEKKLTETSQSQDSGETTSPVIASMRRLQGLLHSRERDLRKSQLKIRELETTIAARGKVDLLECS